MPTINIVTFGGEVPRTTPRLLENTQASVCVNCDLTRGALQALRGPEVVQDCPQGTRSIFKHDVDGWLAWPNVVNVVKSAVLDIDGDTPLGHLFLTGERDYPTQYLAGGIVRRLGIPRPSSAPTVVVSAGAVARTVVAYAWGADNAAQFPPRYGYEDALPQIQSDTATTGPFGGTGGRRYQRHGHWYQPLVCLCVYAGAKPCWRSVAAGVRTFSGVCFRGRAGGRRGYGERLGHSPA